MRASASVVNPNAVEITLSLTMTAGEWKAVSEMLPSKYPGWRVASLITRAIDATVGHVEHVREVNE